MERRKGGILLACLLSLNTYTQDSLESAWRYIRDGYYDRGRYLALDAYRMPASDSTLASAANAIGYAALNLGEPEHAEQYFQKSINHASEHPRLLSAAYSGYGLSQWQQQRHDIAGRYIRLAIEQATELGDSALLCTYYEHLGINYTDQGLHSHARLAFEKGVEIARQKQYFYVLGDLLHELGQTKYQMGQFWDALEDFRAAIIVYEELGAVEKKRYVIETVIRSFAPRVLIGLCVVACFILLSWYRNRHRTDRHSIKALKTEVKDLRSKVEHLAHGLQSTKHRIRIVQRSIRGTKNNPDLIRLIYAYTSIGTSVQKISEEIGCDPKTVRKYQQMIARELGRASIDEEFREFPLNTLTVRELLKLGIGKEN